MGLIVAPLSDAVPAAVHSETSGSGSLPINTTMQMGNVLGLGLVAVFYGPADGRAHAATGLGPPTCPASSTPCGA